MYQIVIGDLKLLDGEYSDPFLKVCMFEGIVKLSFLLVWVKTQIQLLCKELGAFVINIYKVSSSFWHSVAKCIIFFCWKFKITVVKWNTSFTRWYGLNPRKGFAYWKITWGKKKEFFLWRNS